MATRVTSTRLVGRTGELAELEAALREAADGRPSLAFLAGESGVGKSRLLAELERRAREQGATVLGGDAVELGEGELPYAPLVGALRPLARSDDAILGELTPANRAELATLLPELARRDDTPAVSGADDERGSAQRRLFEALLSLLERLGQHGPVVLALEDVHWADRSTRAFLAFLARSLCDEPVLVVLTYRSDELHRRHPLRPLLAELERAPRARRIELARFDRDELAEQLEDILGAPPAPDLVEPKVPTTPLDPGPLEADSVTPAAQGEPVAPPPPLTPFDPGPAPERSGVAADIHLLALERRLVEERAERERIGEDLADANVRLEALSSHRASAVERANEVVRLEGELAAALVRAEAAERRSAGLEQKLRDAQRQGAEAEQLKSRLADVKEDLAEARAPLDVDPLPSRVARRRRNLAQEDSSTRMIAAAVVVILLVVFVLLLATIV
jgi:hypothetical protein